MLGFVSFKEEYDNSQSLLSQNFDRINWGVQNWNISLSPLLRLDFLLARSEALHPRKGLSEEPVCSELQLEEDWVTEFVLQNGQQAIREELQHCVDKFYLTMALHCCARIEQCLRIDIVLWLRDHGGVGEDGSMVTAPVVFITVVLTDAQLAARVVLDKDAVRE